MEYTGYRVVDLSDDDLALFYVHKQNIWELEENQYLFIIINS